jgi:hypothetical protein
MIPLIVDEMMGQSPRRFDVELVFVLKTPNWCNHEGSYAP